MANDGLLDSITSFRVDGSLLVDAGPPWAPAGERSNEEARCTQNQEKRKGPTGVGALAFRDIVISECEPIRQSVRGFADPSALGLCFFPTMYIARARFTRSFNLFQCTIYYCHSSWVKHRYAPATNLEIPHSNASATGPSREGQLSAVDESADELGDEDYANHSDASSNAIEGPRPSKRPRRSKDLSSTTDRDMEESSGCSVELSNEDVATTQSMATPQSEEIPICGFLTLKTIGSKVVYTVSFFQEPSLQPSETDVFTSVDRVDSGRLPQQGQATSRPVKRLKYEREDNELLRRLKEDECLSWDEIAEQFPERSKETLQVHYCTKLKRRSGTSKKAKKRRKFE